VTKKRRKKTPLYNNKTLLLSSFIFPQFVVTVSSSKTTAETRYYVANKDNIGDYFLRRCLSSSSLSVLRPFPALGALCKKTLAA